MALLAGLIAHTADLSVGRVLTLRRDEVSIDERDVILWPGSKPMTLDSHLANAFRSWLPTVGVGSIQWPMGLSRAIGAQAAI